jgi:hypothetical protein
MEAKINDLKRNENEEEHDASATSKYIAITL